MSAQMVLLQLRRDGRDVGEPVAAHLDWRDSPQLRGYLEDAITRLGGYPLTRIGEFELEVRDTRGRYLTRFVTTGKERWWRGTGAV